MDTGYNISWFTTDGAAIAVGFSDNMCFSTSGHHLWGRQPSGGFIETVFPTGTVEVSSVGSHAVALTADGKIFSSAAKDGSWYELARDSFDSPMRGLSGWVHCMQGANVDPDFFWAAATADAVLIATTRFPGNVRSRVTQEFKPVSQSLDKYIWYPPSGGLFTTFSSNPDIGRLMYSGVVAAATGNRHTAVIDADGVLWCWGDNTFGQLGEVRSPDVPVRVADGVSAVACGYRHTAFISDGVLFTAGANSFGQLASGDFKDRSQFTPVECTRPLVDVKAAGSTTVAHDGTSLWVAGGTPISQLGLGSTHSTNTLTVVDPRDRRFQLAAELRADGMSHGDALNMASAALGVS